MEDIFAKINIYSTCLSKLEIAFTAKSQNFTLRCDDRVNVLWHCLQLQLRSPVWMSKWVLKLLCCAKDFEQYWHLKGLSPLCSCENGKVFKIRGEKLWKMRDVLHQMSEGERTLARTYKH